MSKTLGTVFSATLICLGIASTSAHAIPVDKTVAEKSSKDFSGIADWYADMYHGKKTASGELHDKTKFMAAHRTLPFGTKVRCVNRRNNKACVVTINDRGPFTPNRVIDLSYAAAKELGVTGGGKSVDCYVVHKDTKAGAETEAKVETKKLATVSSAQPATAITQSTKPALATIQTTKPATAADSTTKPATIAVAAVKSVATSKVIAPAVPAAPTVTVAPAVTAATTASSTAPIPGTVAPAKSEELRFTVTAAAPAKIFTPKAAAKSIAIDTKDIALDPSTAEE